MSSPPAAPLPESTTPSRSGNSALDQAELEFPDKSSDGMLMTLQERLEQDPEFVKNVSIADLVYRMLSLVNLRMPMLLTDKDREGSESSTEAEGSVNTGPRRQMSQLSAGPQGVSSKDDFAQRIVSQVVGLIEPRETSSSIKAFLDKPGSIRPVPTKPDLSNLDPTKPESRRPASPGPPSAKSESPNSNPYSDTVMSECFKDEDFLHGCIRLLVRCGADPRAMSTSKNAKSCWDLVYDEPLESTKKASNKLRSLRNLFDLHEMNSNDLEKIESRALQEQKRNDVERSKSNDSRQMDSNELKKSESGDLQEQKQDDMEQTKSNDAQQSESQSITAFQLTKAADGGSPTIDYSLADLFVRTPPRLPRRDIKTDKQWPTRKDIEAGKRFHIHVLSNNGPLLAAIFDLLADLGLENLDRLTELFWDGFRAPAVTPESPSLIYRQPLYLSSRDYRPIGLQVDYKALVFPYFDVTTIGLFEQRRDEYLKLCEKLMTRPGKHARSSIFHCVRTLDETYYPGLPKSELDRRNQDQVITKVYQGNKEASENDPILMVPQLWIWQVGTMVVSACSEAKDESLKYQQPPGLWETAVKPSRAPVWQNADVQIGLIIAEKIEHFGQNCTIDGMTFAPPLVTFETGMVAVLSSVHNYMRDLKASKIHYKKEKRFLSILSDMMAELAMIEEILEQQKEILDKLLNDRPKQESARLKEDRHQRGNDDLVELLKRLAAMIGSPPPIKIPESDTMANTSSNSQGSVQPTEHDSPHTTANDRIATWRSIEAQKAAGKVSDAEEPLQHNTANPPSTPNIQSEFESIHSLLDAQILVEKPTVEAMPDQTDPWLPVEQARQRLDEYQKRITKVRSDAMRVETTVKDQLELRKTYASVKDAHNSLILSAAVIGFTVITIIFAPLAFLTALFALKMDGFGRLRMPNQDETYSAEAMAGVFVGSEAITWFITALAITVTIMVVNRRENVDDEESPLAQTTDQSTAKDNVWRKFIAKCSNMIAPLSAKAKTKPSEDQV